MTVYIEYVLINNFVIDYLLLKATFELTGKAVSNRRLFVCAFLGSGFALLYPLITENKIIFTLAKVVFGFILVFIACKNLSFKSYYLNAVIFFVYTFLTGGALIGIYNLFGMNYSDEYFTALTFIPVYFILRSFGKAVKFIYNRRHVMRSTVDVELSLDDVKLKAVGFFDTGNGVYDGNSPVIFCEKKFAENFISIKGIKFKRITVNTINGAKESLAFKLDSVKIYIKDKLNIFNNVTLCVSKHGVGSGYDVILHPALMEVEDVFKAEKKITKAS